MLGGCQGVLGYSGVFRVFCGVAIMLLGCSGWLLECLVWFPEMYWGVLSGCYVVLGYSWCF